VTTPRNGSAIHWRDLPPEPSDGLKTCTRCGERRPLDMFTAKPGRGKNVCNPCRTEYMRKYSQVYRGRSENPDWLKRSKYAHIPRHEKRAALGRIGTYGLAHERYREMEESQLGRCAICQQERRPLTVDHDHETGRVRMLLCRDCNGALGMMRENPEWIQNMVAYAKMCQAGKHPPGKDTSTSPHTTDA
jgi:hypothetical protein